MIRAKAGRIMLSKNAAKQPAISSQATHITITYGRINNSTCPICYEEFSNDARIEFIPGCLHYFHKSCFDMSYKQRQRCPMCNAAI